jgi:hypothetical protein
MLGAAGEVAFLEMAKSCADWLPESSGDKLRETINGRRSSMPDKHEAFQKAVHARKPELNAARPGLGDDLYLTLGLTLDVIRLGRNDVMHQYQRSFDRITTAGYLQTFIHALRRMYDLKTFFDVDLTHRSASEPEA